MGAKNNYGSTGRGDVLNFPPEVLKIITDENHKSYDPRAERDIDEAMVLSIMKFGVMVPLVISRDGDNVFVVDGRQRRKNALEANKRLKKEGQPEVICPCVWKRADEAKLFEVSIATNEVRTGDSLIERAKKMQRLIDLGRDEEQVSIVFGCTIATVKNALALLECSPSVRKAVESGQVSATIATKLSKLSREEQEKTLDKMVKEGTTKGAAATRAAAKPGSKAAKHALSPKARERIYTALTNGASEHLKGLNKEVAKVVAATIAFMEGDAKAFAAWSEVADIVKQAMISSKDSK